MKSKQWLHAVPSHRLQQLSKMALREILFGIEDRRSRVVILMSWTNTNSNPWSPLSGGQSVAGRRPTVDSSLVPEVVSEVLRSMQMQDVGRSTCFGSSYYYYCYYFYFLLKYYFICLIRCFTYKYSQVTITSSSKQLKFNSICYMLYDYYYYYYYYCSYIVH